MSALRLGTRGSALALAQSGMIADDLRKRGQRVELVVLQTSGDGTSAPLTGRAQEGIFTSAISQALTHHHIDFAVHSFKDVPVNETCSTVIAAVPGRIDPRDTVIANASSLATLPRGAIVGTCSARRAAYVARTRPDLRIEPIRGNIDQRIASVRSGAFDAIILAAAGLQRLGVAHEIAEVIDTHALIPAPAQGALALECRSEDMVTRRAVAELDDPESHLAALVERAVLDSVDASDATAMGALAVVRDGRLSLIADASALDGSKRLVVERSVRLESSADRIGGLHLAHAVASELIAHLGRMAA